MFKTENLIEALPAKTPIYVDTGFEGISSLSPELNIKKPKKKKKGKKLNGGEKLGNRLISRERVKVEHSIGGYKRFKISSEIFRGVSHSMDDVIQICCGLWNHHLRMSATTT